MHEIKIFSMFVLRENIGHCYHIILNNTPLIKNNEILNIRNLYYKTTNNLTYFLILRNWN